MSAGRPDARDPVPEQEAFGGALRALVRAVEEDRAWIRALVGTALPR